MDEQMPTPRRMVERVRARLDERLQEMERAGTLRPDNPEARGVGDAIQLIGRLNYGPPILPKDRWA